VHTCSAFATWASSQQAGPQNAYQHWMAAGAVGLLAGGALVASSASGEAPSPAATKYTREEVAKHKTPQDRIWVTYKDGVYDITEFVAMHPGGSQKIMLAAGGAVDPFWAMYQQHNKPEINDILKDYRIGVLDGAQEQPAIADPYMNEPTRHPVLVVQAQKPFNAETPTSLLASSIVTPTDLFYVRNHLPVPEVDPARFALTVEGEGLRTVRLTLDELKSNFKKHTITATVQCAGNRRSEMKAVKEVKGLNWESGAVGTATFGGVRLRDVLRHAGASPPFPVAQAVCSTPPAEDCWPVAKHAQGRARSAAMCPQAGKWVCGVLWLWLLCALLCAIGARELHTRFLVRCLKEAVWHWCALLMT
jgi:cytochrome b involved in lipid metabolism